MFSIRLPYTTYSFQFCTSIIIEKANLISKGEGEPGDKPICMAVEVHSFARLIAKSNPQVCTVGKSKCTDHFPAGDIEFG